MKAHREIIGIALFFLEPQHYVWWMVKSTPLPFYYHERDPVSILQEAVWDPVLVWTGVEILASPPELDLWIVQPVAVCHTD